MIKKERHIPIKLMKLEALLRRLALNNPKRNKLEEEYAKVRAGYRGEKSIDYYLNSLDEKELYIFHDIRLQHSNTEYFQIDILLLTKKYLLILEIKNMSGTLCFDQTFNQLIRILNGKEEAFPDPIMQVKRQQNLLQHWIASNHFPPLPVYSLILISNPKTLLKSIPANSDAVSKKVIHASQLQNKIEIINRRERDDVITTREINKISGLLLKLHSPSDPEILSHFQLEKKDIIKGVQCPKCKRLPMLRSKNGNWCCSGCKLISKDAHIAALDDYCLLISATITNQELRNFLNITSSSSATKLLKKLNLNHSGSYRHRIYHLTSPNK
ncbi:nuclease-related domain-containing protein [Metabacillus idriensis]|uniref:nuclease-related domain-containing protein n=1 Tax=Metabacillus idriensis TaxID=324768 RepID=UPI00174CABC8|nr:NERD domain-containing protein [Metabacillus idriensis]